MSIVIWRKKAPIAFAFCHLLGFQLLPRLKAIHKQRLYRAPKLGHARGLSQPPGPFSDADQLENAHRTGYDDMINTARR